MLDGYVSLSAVDAVGECGVALYVLYKVALNVDLLVAAVQGEVHAPFGVDDSEVEACFAG